MRVLRTLGRRWRNDFQACLQIGIGRHRFEATRFPVSKRSMQKLGENQKLWFAGGPETPRRDLVEHSTNIFLNLQPLSFGLINKILRCNWLENETAISISTTRFEASD